MQSYMRSIVKKICKINKDNTCFTCLYSTDSKIRTSGVDPMSRLIWVDLEFTGLDTEKDKILEAACIITEANLEIVAQGPDIVIHQPKDVLESMGPWCQEVHQKTGLIDAVRNSTVTLEKAEEILLEFVSKYVKENECALAGNTVYMDRIFLQKYMPKFNQYMHYRIVDVSTVKELCRRWNRHVFAEVPKKVFTHRALDDILESIEELRFYKNNIFDKIVNE